LTRERRGVCGVRGFFFPFMVLRPEGIPIRGIDPEKFLPRGRYGKGLSSVRKGLAGNGIFLSASFSGAAGGVAGKGTENS